MKLGVLALLSMGLVVLLFLLSEREVHRNNAFTRRFPPQPVIRKYDLSIGFESYYIAGQEGSNLFLGNTTAPLHLLQLDLETRDTTHLRITLDRTDLPFRAVRIALQPPFFYVMDGRVPCIFRGRIGEWQADLWMEGDAYFSRAIPLDTNKVFIRTISGATGVSTLGLLEKKDSFRVALNPSILEKQIDGIFDSDGILAAAPDGNALGYVYFYRNQYMVMDRGLDLISRQRTIDTVRTAQLQLAKLPGNRTTMEAPPLLVNKMAAMYGDWMLIASDRLGKNEAREMIRMATIIDVYNWEKGAYEFSFYIYDIGDEKAREFAVFDGQLVALVGDRISVYELKGPVIEKFLTENKKPFINDN